MTELAGFVCYAVLVGWGLWWYRLLCRRHRRVVPRGLIRVDTPLSPGEVARLKAAWMARRHDRPMVLP